MPRPALAPLDGPSARREEEDIELDEQEYEPEEIPDEEEYEPPEPEWEPDEEPPART